MVTEYLLIASVREFKETHTQGSRSPEGHFCSNTAPFGQRAFPSNFCHRYFGSQLNKTQVPFLERTPDSEQQSRHLQDSRMRPGIRDPGVGRGRNRTGREEKAGRSQEEGRVR